MAYWSSEADGCDFAFDSIGVTVIQISELLFREADLVREKNFREQSILAHLRCLRVIGEQFPKSLRVSFRRHHFEKARDAFREWLGSVNLSAKRKEELFDCAEKEFSLFEERILAATDRPEKES